MSKEEILKRILTVLEEKMKVDRKILTEKNYSTPFTGGTFHFSAVDLFYLFHFMEEEFHCTIETELIAHYEFNSILGIADVLDKVKAR